MTSNFPGQSLALCGQASQVTACGSHSAGMAKPSSAGAAAGFVFKGDMANNASIAAKKCKGKRFFPGQKQRRDGAGRQQHDRRILTPPPVLGRDEKYLSKNENNW